MFDDTTSSSRRSFLRNSLLASGLAVGLSAGVGTAAAKPKSGRRAGTIPVFASDVDGDGAIFYRVAQDGNATDSFVKGPGKAPFGSGSVEFTTTGTTDRLFYYNYDYGVFGDGDPVALADITALGYDAYTNDDTLVPALKMEIDPDGPGTSGVDDYATLNFEPYYNNTVSPGQWVRYDVLTADAGVWLSGVSGEGSNSDPVTWSRLLELYPDASIRFGFGIGVGSGWAAPNFVGNVDDLTIGVGGKTTRYNFEGRGASSQ